MQTSPLSEWSEYSNASLFFVLPNTKPCLKEGNRKPFVISGLGLSLRCFSEFIVHSSVELPYTPGCLVFKWDLGQGEGGGLRSPLRLLGRKSFAFYFVYLFFGPSVLEWSWRENANWKCRACLLNLRRLKQWARMGHETWLCMQHHTCKRGNTYITHRGGSKN